MTKDKEYKSALKVNKGIEQPPIVNPHLKKIIKKKTLTAEQYIEGILKGDMSTLSQAITLVESSLPRHKEVAEKIIDGCLPHSGNSLRIGITGVPGVGKSTFIEAMGMEIINAGNKLAVLAIDPSSERTKGSILGDKTRMEELSTSKNAFIRPSPSAGSLGGVARKTRESIILCEAAGFNVIFIETVGVGQSETAVHSMVDFFLLLMLAGAGDELQGIKRGIMEMADAIAITKSDGNNVHKAGLARVQYQNALHLFPKQPSGWDPKVLTCSSVDKNGLPDIWNTIKDYKELTTENKYFTIRRADQSKYWMHETINERLKDMFFGNPDIAEKIKTYEKKVINNEISSFNAAHFLLDEYIKKH